nr:hypothetical protein [Candidatus Sigynarchaeota archaeon]
MKISSIKTRFSSITGFTLIGVYITFVMLSLGLYPTAYSPMENWLSDLGNWRFNPKGALFYNLGCILTAIFEVLYMAGLSAWDLAKKWQKILLRIGQTSGFISAFCLFMGGIYSEDFWITHMILSEIHVIALGFFATFVSAALIIDPRFWRPVGVVGFVFATLDMIFGVDPKIPIMDSLAIFGTIAFVGLVATNMASFKRKNEI